MVMRSVSGNARVIRLCVLVFRGSALVLQAVQRPVTLTFTMAVTFRSLYVAAWFAVVVVFYLQCPALAQPQAAPTTAAPSVTTPSPSSNDNQQVINKDTHTATAIINVAKVKVLSEPPYVMTKDTEGQKLFEGMFVDILTYIMNAANVTFNISEDVHTIYGKEHSPGMWSGLVGSLLANYSDGGADLAVAPLTISSRRAQAVDFTLPIMSSGLRILYKVPDPWTDTETFAILLSPFTAGLWVVILLMFLSVSVLFYVIGRFSPYEDHAFVGKAATYEGLTFINSFLYTFSSLTFQGYTAAPRSMAGRVLAAFWWMFVLLVIAAYTAGLCAIFLAYKPSIRSVPFATFEELAQQSQVAYGIVKGGSTEAYLSKSNRTIERRVYSSIQANANLVKVINIDDGINRVRRSNGNFALIMEGPLAEYEASQQPCDLMVLGEELGHHAWAFACRKGTDLCPKLNIAIMKMLEEDYVYSLQQKWYHQGCKRDASEYIFDGVAFFDTFGGQPAYYADRSVTLRRFGTGFLVLFIGMLAASCLLLGEIFYAKRRGTAVPQRLPRSSGMDDQERIDREYKDEAEA